MGPIGWINIDQHHANFRRGVLHQDPFGIIRTPQTQTIKGFQSRGQEPTGKTLYPSIKILVGPAQILMQGHDGIVVGNPRHGLPQVVANGLRQERLISSTHFNC